MIVYRNQETIDMLLEKAFCDGYEYAQREYAKINLGPIRKLGGKIKNTATEKITKTTNKIKQKISNFKPEDLDVLGLKQGFREFRNGENLAGIKF